MNKLKQVFSTLTTLHAFNIGRVFGIKVDLDWSLLLLMLLMAFNMYGLVEVRHPDISFVFVFLLSALIGVGLIGSILAHELAHAIVGRKFGIRCSGIKLYIFGGVARMTSNNVTGKSELIISAAGPAMSVLVGIVCALLCVLDSHIIKCWYLETVAFYLAEMNIMLAIFNIIPAFPLDGGRILRASIWMYTRSFYKATKIATRIGMGFARGFIFTGFLVAFGINVPFFGVGLMNGIILAIIGLMLMRWIQVERMGLL